MKHSSVYAAATTLLACLALASLPLRAQAHVSEGTLSLPYYQEGPPNPNALFDQYTTHFSYPYVLRDNLTSNRVNRVFRTIVIENEYLKCTILPDVGGHVYTCLDKINDVPMFYDNPSIKEAAIGMRGGWAAFGLEFNFPVSHNWMTVSPVDFAYATEKDGGASITLSNVDRVYGMQWTVRLVLHSGSTVLEQQVTLNNRSDVRHRFYWWSNAGVQAWDDTRICYPMRYSAAHGYADVDHWPIDATGRDLSLLKNHIDGPVSRFVHGSREAFMGIWNPHTNAGVAHFADYAELPAKKIWSWGVDADALDWRKALSDNNSAYVEVQAGLFRNQETYAFLDPRQTIHFTEYWMPLRELGGLARANLVGAVNLARSGNMLTASLNVNAKLPNANIRLLDGTNVLRSETSNLFPEHTWKAQIPIATPSHAYSVELHDQTGAILLAQTEGKYDWTPDSEIHTGPQQPATIPPPAQRTGDDWLQSGRGDELSGRILIAATTYAEGLKAYPHDHALTVAAGRLGTILLHYEDAVDLLKPAQSSDTPDPEIAYYLALAYDGLGDEGQARNAYEAAARLPAMRPAAALRLGEQDARIGDLAGSETWLTAALHDAPDDLRTAEELAAIRLAQGRSFKATAFAEDWYSRFPTSYFLAEVLGRPQITHLAADPERILNTAAEYLRLGLYEHALAVLSRDYPVVPIGEMEPGAATPAANPILAYYRAFCLQRLHRPYASEAAAARKMPLAYIFPSGAQTEEVMEAALHNDPSDATAHYLLGLLQFSIGLTAQSESNWQLAHDLHAVFPGLDVNRGLARLYVDHDPTTALLAFREATRTDATNDAVYIGIDQALSLLRRPPADFIAAIQTFPDKPNMRAKLVYELALHEAEAGDYPTAAALLSNRFFPREEGGTNVRQVWIEIELLRLESLASSRRCDQALSGLAQLDQVHADMIFTRDGLSSVIATPRVRLRVAGINQACEQIQAAADTLKEVVSATNTEDLLWQEKAVRLLPGYNSAEIQSRLSAALAQAQLVAPSSSYRMYLLGMLQMDSGDKKAAAQSFGKVFLLPDQTLAYHLTRIAQGLTENDQPAQTR